MLNTVVAIVLGNALVAAVFALGVVLLARWYHKPALLHGLWVVVLLKLVTPPMLTIPVPVEIAGIMPVEEAEESAVGDEAGPAESTAAPDVPAEPPAVLEPVPTIVIESPPEPEEAHKGGEDDLLADFPIQITSAFEPAAAMEQQPAAAAQISSEPIGFPATAPAADGVRTIKSSASAAFSWQMLLWPMLVVWALGALIVFLSAWRQILRFERSLREAIPAPDALRIRVEELAWRSGLSRPPAVYLLSGAVSPMLWGFGRKPRLLLPRDLLAGLDEEAIETLILHELAHMRRGDHWVRFLELCCQCIYWWHPVVWWGRKQLRIVEEECCDAFVVEHCQGGVYARALLATVDFLSQKKTAMPPAASGIGNLEFLKRRLTMIMQGGVSARMAGLPKFLLLTAAVVGLSVLPRLVAQTTEADEAESTSAEEPAESVKLPAPQMPALPEPATLIGQEPIEFENQPKGYPTAQLEVRDLAFSRDGKYLAAGYGKWDTLGELVVYEYSTKKVLKKFPFSKGIASVRFSVDGKYLAASIWNNVLQIWDTESWELVADKTNGAHVARLAFSPDGKYLAWANERGELRLLTVGQWDQERPIAGEFFRFQKVAFSPDSKRLCAVGGSFSEPRFGRGLILEVETGKEIAKIESEGAVIASAAFSPDGKELATGEYATNLRFWEADTGRPISSLQIGGTMDTLEYTPDGTLVGPSFSGQVHMIKNRQILRTMSGHEGRSLTVRMAPDGKTLVSGGIDALIRVWNPETGVPMDVIRPNEVLEDTQEAVLAIAHSPDGRYVVTTHEDTSVRLRNAESGEFVKMMKGHEDVVATVAFSPDGKTLATGSYDHSIKLWNVETGEAIRELKGHSNWVFSVAFSPDGKTLASGGYDKSIRLWNVETGESAVLEGHSAAVRSLGFSPGGEQLVSGSSDRTLRLWDIKSREMSKEMKGHTAAVRAVAFSPDGRKIASASEDQTVRFWDPATGESTQELKGHTGMVWALAFSPRGRTLASGGFDNSLRIWNGETGTALQTLTGHQDVITALSYAPNSSSLVTGSYDKTLKFWPAVEPPIPALADLNLGDKSNLSPARFAVFSPDGTRMITGSQNGSLRLWNLDTGRVIKTAVQPRSLAHGAYSPDGKLLATGSFGKEAYLWDANTLELLAPLETTQEQHLILAFSLDGKRLASGTRDGVAVIWDVETREKIRELPSQDMPVLGLAFSPDGSLLATATGDAKDYQKPGAVRLWNTKTWEEVANLEGPKRKMRRVRFSPDGKTLVACGSQQELLVYDVPNRKLAKQIFIGPEVSGVAFLPDSRTVVLGAFNGIVGLWDLESGSRVANYEGHRNSPDNNRYVLDVTVSADASVVASAATDGHVKLWPTSAAPPVRPLASYSLENAEPFSVALSPDGGRLAVATTAKTVEIRETKTGDVLQTISGLKTSCVSLSYSPDGKSIAGALQEGKVFVWDAATGEQRLMLEGHPGGARRANFSPDGQMLTTCGWDETAAVWNVADGSLRYRTEKQGLALSDARFSPDGKLLLTATGSYHEWRKPGTIKIWKADDGTNFGEMPSHEAEIKGILFDAGGNFLSYGGNGAKVWNRMNRTLLRSIGAGTTITAAELSPDGNTLFTGNRSGHMIIYDVKTGNVKQTLEGHEALVYSMASSLDGTVLASSAKDGSVSLWPGSPIPGLSPLAQAVDDPQQSRTIAYSPDGKWLAVGGKKKTISLREASTLKEVRTLEGHNGMLCRLVFTPDGKLLSSSSDGTARLWNIADGQEIAKWTVHKEKLANVRGLAVSSDGKQFAAGNDNGETCIYDVDTREELFRLPAQSLPLTGIAFSPDGRVLATCTGNWQEAKVPGELKLWNAGTGEPVVTLEGHEGEIRGLLFNRDGKLLISYGADKSVRIWDVANRRLVRKQDCPHSVSAVGLIDEGQLLIGDTLGLLYLADEDGTVRRQTRGHYTVLSEIDISPEGTQFVTISHDGLLKTWSLAPPKAVIEQLPSRTRSDARLAEKIRTWQPTELETRNAQTAVRIKQFKPHGQQVWFAVYSPDGNLLATGGKDGTVKLWNAETFEILLTLTGHEDVTSYAAFSPDGTKLASVALGKDKSLRLWDVATGRSLAVAKGHQEGCRRVAFSPDGKLIATASEDSTVRLWNADTLEQVRTLNLELNAYSVAFSPNGKLLAVGTGNWREKKDGQISIWNPETGERIKTLANSDGLVFNLQFLKDSRRLLSAQFGVGLAIWNIESGAIEETYKTLGYTRWIEISRDEKRLVTSHSLGMVTLWDRHVSQSHTEFKASEGFIHAATFSPDGNRLVVADEASTLSVWELRDAPQAQAEETTSTKP